MQRSSLIWLSCSAGLLWWLFVLGLVEWTSGSNIKRIASAYTTCHLMFDAWESWSLIPFIMCWSNLTICFVRLLYKQLEFCYDKRKHIKLILSTVWVWAVSLWHCGGIVQYLKTDKWYRQDISTCSKNAAVSTTRW